MSSSQNWQLCLLGACRLQHGGATVRFARRKGASLLAYLALHPQPHSREKLATLFWADFPDSDARRSLRAALSALRAEIGATVVVSDGDAVRLNPAFPLWVDAVEFNSSAASFLASPPADVAAPFLDLYAGDLLPDAYDDWVTPERERLRSLYIEALIKLTQAKRSSGDYAGAIAAAQRLLSIEPANESAHQQLMSCYAAAGDRSAALRQFEVCRRVLKEDIDAEPSADTIALFQQIKNQSAAPTQRSNLPVLLTSFVGRQREMAGIKRLLAEHRLVTLTGPGGSGKTRLAIEVVAGLDGEYKDGVYFCDLAAVTDANALPSAVAQSVGASGEGSDRTAVVVAHLRQRRALLLLDNCERLVDACTQLVQAILAACPHTIILATSREVLGVAGESIMPVPPLSTPHETEVHDLAALNSYESACLFFERTAGQPGVVLADSDAPAISSVCLQLEGMPLAIELAAAHVRALPVAQIAAHLSDRFALLASGSRSGPPRQHSLRAAIDWSYDLLSPDEQALLRRLSVFAGSFAEDAAPAVFGETHSAAEVLDLLARLVDKSLLTVEQSGSDHRYRFLDTIRMYAWEKLDQARERDETTARYLGYYLSWADDLAAVAYQGRYLARRQREDPERSNVVQAIAWCAETHRLEIGMRIIRHEWYALAAWGEIPRLGYWVKLILADEENMDLPLRARAVLLAHMLERSQQDWPLVDSLIERALLLAHDTGSPELYCSALLWYVKCLAHRGDCEQALFRYQELALLAEQLGWRPQYAQQLDVADALTHVGRIEEASPFWAEGLEGARELGWRSGIAFGLRGQGDVALLRGELATAERLYRQSLAAAVDDIHHQDQTLALEAMARLAEERGECKKAGALWGAAAAEFALTFATKRNDEPIRAAHMASLRAKMGDAAFEAVYARGQAMTLEQAVELALADS